MSYNNPNYQYSPPGSHPPNQNPQYPSQPAHPNQQPPPNYQNLPPNHPNHPHNIANYPPPTMPYPPNHTFPNHSQPIMVPAGQYHPYPPVNPPISQPGSSDSNSDLSITVQNTQAGPTRRGPWSPEEDRKLMDLISIFGPSNWVRISNSLCTRTPKQCRERYHQNLKPSLNRSPITQEEGLLIEKLVAKHGKKWAEIARHLNGRSDNAIKNWWNGGANRRRRASSTIHVKLIDRNNSNPNSKSNSDDEMGTPVLSNPGLGISTEQKHPSTDGPPQQIPPIGSSHHVTLPPVNSPTIAAPIRPLKPSQYPQIQHLPQISFNTSMFGASPPTKFTKGANSPALDSRLSSFDNMNSSTILPPINSPSINSNTNFVSSKRRLIDDQTIRRHSTANTLYGSSPGEAISTLNSSEQTSPLQHESPLAQGSRDSSITHAESTNQSSTTSSTESRTSSVAHDLFPNPLKDFRNNSFSNKRNVSQHSFHSPSLAPARPSLSNSSKPEVKKETEKTEEKPKEEEPEVEEKAKISVSSLID